MDTYDEIFMDAVSAELRAERAAKQLTIQQLAERSGLVKMTLQRYLNGKRDIPMRALYAITEALQVSPGQILDRASARARQSVTQNIEGDGNMTVGGDIENSTVVLGDTTTQAEGRS